MFIVKVKDVSSVIEDLTGERLMFFTKDGYCDVISIHDVKSLLLSGKIIKTKYILDPDILKINLELGHNMEKLCEFNDLGQIVFFDKDFLVSLISKQEQKYLSVNNFAKLKNLSESTVKRKILSDDISGVIALYSDNNKISAYAIPENAEVL